MGFSRARSAGVPIAAETKTGGDDKGEENEAALHFADGTGDRERLEGIAAFYSDFTSYVETLYTRFVTTAPARLQGTRRADEEGIVSVITENRRFILRAQSQMPQNKNYLVSHAVRSSDLFDHLGARSSCRPSGSSSSAPPPSCTK